MTTITFLVQGSSPDPYEVEFIRRDHTKLSAYCNCAAGQNGQYCKHRMRILDGESQGVVSDNIDEVKLVASWLSGTDIAIAIQELKHLEGEADKIKKRISAAKKSLARALMT